MSERISLWMGSLAGRVLELRDREEGQTLVEYSLVIALVAVVAIATLYAIGTDINTIFTDVKNAMDSAVSSA